MFWRVVRSSSRFTLKIACLSSKHWIILMTNYFYMGRDPGNEVQCSTRLIAREIRNRVAWQCFCAAKWLVLCFEGYRNKVFRSRCIAWPSMFPREKSASTEFLNRSRRKVLSTRRRWCRFSERTRAASADSTLGSISLGLPRRTDARTRPLAAHRRRAVSR